ncbi:hypothetical protein T439DRAFT_320545 [Meredithblackwellia eburnea MCA 4105]
MGFCTRCGEILPQSSTRCRCGGHSKEAKTKALFGQESNSDKWSKSYLSKPSTTSSTGASTSSSSALKSQLTSSNSNSSARAHQHEPSHELKSTFGSVLSPKDRWECVACSVKFIREQILYPHPNASTDKSLSEVFFCRDCFAQRFSKGACRRCKHAVLSDAPFIRHEGEVWHKECFVCRYCGDNTQEPLIDLSGQPSCETCFDTHAYRRADIPPSPHLASQAKFSSTNNTTNALPVPPAPSRWGRPSMGGGGTTPPPPPGTGLKGDGGLRKLSPSPPKAGTGGRRIWEQRENSPLVKSFDELGEKMRGVGLGQPSTSGFVVEERQGEGTRKPSPFLVPDQQRLSSPVKLFPSSPISMTTRIPSNAPSVKPKNSPGRTPPPPLPQVGRAPLAPGLGSTNTGTRATSPVKDRWPPSSPVKTQVNVLPVKNTSSVGRTSPVKDRWPPSSTTSSSIWAKKGDNKDDDEAKEQKPPTPFKLRPTNIRDERPVTPLLLRGTSPLPGVGATGYLNSTSASPTKTERGFSSFLPNNSSQSSEPSSPTKPTTAGTLSSFLPSSPRKIGLAAELALSGTTTTTNSSQVREELPPLSTRVNIPFGRRSPSPNNRSPSQSHTNPMMIRNKPLPKAPMKVPSPIVPIPVPANTQPTMTTTTRRPISWGPIRSTIHDGGSAVLAHPSSFMATKPPSPMKSIFGGGGGAAAAGYTCTTGSQVKVAGRRFGEDEDEDKVLVSPDKVAFPSSPAPPATPSSPGKKAQDDVGGGGEDPTHCGICRRELGYGSFVQLPRTGEVLHRECFRCAGCREMLDAEKHVESKGGIWHRDCAPPPPPLRAGLVTPPQEVMEGGSSISPTSSSPCAGPEPEPASTDCAKCHLALGSAPVISVPKTGETFHQRCFECGGCGKMFGLGEGERGFVIKDRTPYHELCAPRPLSPIKSTFFKEAHEPLKASTSRSSISVPIPPRPRLSNFSPPSPAAPPTTSPTKASLFATRTRPPAGLGGLMICAGCSVRATEKETVPGPLGRRYHAKCLKCAACARGLDSEARIGEDGVLRCEGCRKTAARRSHRTPLTTLA